MTEAKRDANRITGIIGVSSVDGVTPIPVAVNPVNGRMLVDLPSGAGTVTSVASADGSITVTTPTTTPDLAVVKAPKLSTARTIAGVSFDGTANIAIASTGLSDTANIQYTSGKDATGGYAGLTLFKINFKNAANTFTNFLTNATTAARTYTFKDADGTVAFTSDITGTNSGTNTGDVTLAGTPNYITIAGQVITRALIDLTTHVTGILTSVNGGTGNGFTKFTGPTTAEKTFTLPDASSTIVVQGGALGTPSSGTLTSATGLPVAGITASTVTALGVGSIELGHASDTTIARVSAGVISVEGVTIPSISSTSTLTNKRITPRILSAASYTTDTGTSLNCDNLDEFIVTAQAGALKLNNPTGTPTDGQVLFVAVKGTAARALTYDTQFLASTVALPTTTVTTARLNMLFIWAADTSNWILLAAV